MHIQRDPKLKPTSKKITNVIVLTVQPLQNQKNKMRISGENMLNGHENVNAKNAQFNFLYAT